MTPPIPWSKLAHTHTVGANTFSCQQMSLPKPQMRNLLQASIKRNLAVTAGVTTAAVAAYYFLVKAPRKQQYAEFYK